MTATLPPFQHRTLVSEVTAAERLAHSKGLQHAFYEDLAYARFCTKQLERRADPVALARTQTFVTSLRQRIAEAPERRPS